MRINNDVADVLGNVRVEGNNLFLSGIQLDRKLYLDVNKVIESIGGKWNRKTKAHVFDSSPEDIIEQILISGEYTDEKKEYQFFETPEGIAKKLIKMADIQDGETVLEPSAGKGAIAKFVNGCLCLEKNDKNRDYLIEKGFDVAMSDDFLNYNTKHDVIIANPPFTKQQDIDHVTHMIELANRVVVSVMSTSVIFRSNKKTVEFRELVESFGGTIEPLPEKSFSESGTNVNTCIVKVMK